MLMDCELAAASISAGGKIAIDLAQFFRRFLALPEGVAGLLPIWSLHTHVFDEFEFTPYLNIVSPEPGCGKTTVADVLSALCRKATSPTCGSPAFLRRKIAADQPTLILDEWDSLDPTVRRLCINFLNTGFRFDGTYGLLTGGMATELPTFCPKVIVGRSLVRLPEATQSRCICFSMHKLLPSEKLDKFGAQQRREAQHLLEQCEAWAEDFRANKVRVKPLFPDGLSPRQQDIVAPLLEIADACGGPWPLGLRQALIAMFARRDLPSAENELLRAIRSYAKKADYVLSQDFCAWANAQPETPWLEPNVKKLSQARLAEMLRQYDIYPSQINRVVRGRQINRRGYYVSQFIDVFARYLPEC